MASRREPTASPGPWQTEDEEMESTDNVPESWDGISESTNDGDYQEAEDDELDEDDFDGIEDEDHDGRTTVYFDAEQGTLVDQDGDEVTFDVASEDEEEDDEDDDDDDEDGGEEEQDDEGGAAAAAASQPAQTNNGAGRHTVVMTQEQILRFLRHAGLLSSGNGGTRAAPRGWGELLALAGDDADENTAYNLRPRQARKSFVGDRYPPIPSEEGKRLMESGTFGANDRRLRTACGQLLSESTLKRKRKLSMRMLDRELGFSPRARNINSLAAQDLIPNSKAELIINMNKRCYSGQFSEDGSFFFACGQDFKVRLYDTSNPYHWKYYKTVHYYGGQWTITDSTLSPDNKNLAYSSIRSQVCMASTDQNDDSEPRLLDFSNMGQGSNAGRGGWTRGSRGHFGIWSLRFSGDGSEIVAGTSDQSVYVYDLEAQRSILRIRGHQDDVNAVCFGDRMSPHILYSGSDDTTLKVWDRRSLSDMRPAGMFLGHTEGLTYIDSKGDGRYVISNAKDQTCKLWDLRKMISTDVGESINPMHYSKNFDYRFQPYDMDEHVPHPHDCSLVTFRGHSVLATLIRCHFSPPGSTDGRYIYSGSHDGKIYVWNLDGTTAGTIDVLAATRNSRPASDERYVDSYEYYGREGTWKTIVRDCSWHPYAPVIAATSWNGWDHGLGTCTVHSWTDGAGGDEVGSDEDDPQIDGTNLGSTPMGARVTARLRHDERYYEARNQPRTRSNRQRLRDRMGLAEMWQDDE